MTKISVSKIVFFCLSAILSIVAGFFCGKLLDGNDLAIQTIVTVFSILAGFLIAVMTIIAEPLGAIGRSWRFYEKKRSAIKKRLSRQRFLFVMYILTLILIFSYVLLKSVIVDYVKYIESIMLGLSVFCFLLSLHLPWDLMEIQLSRYDEIIDEKLKKGI